MFLLDTHTLLWFIEDDIKLSIQAKSILSENSTSKFISIVTLWEIAVKYSLKKLELNISLADFFNLIHSSDINIINISTEHLLILNSIEHHHKDPFDRIIIAQAIAENFTIITKDENFSKYEVNIIW
ncbi:MAG: type II toxin-antitoxin system VapC family toxin [Saprospirales bacterium]|nr:type II toxin-antitoxin system VapC family toxin [Saprospirales bacterium]